jgi:hypothetical protein
MELYKILRVERSRYRHEGPWTTPEDAEPAAWMPPVHPIVPHRTGYQLCRRADLVAWLGAGIYTAESRGSIVDSLIRDLRAECQSANTATRSWCRQPTAALRFTSQVFMTRKESDARDPFPFKITPPIVHVDRSDDEDVEIEGQIIARVGEYGGTFAATRGEG